jgi:hypothetical protein
VIQDHSYGSVLTTLDSAIRRHLVRIEESGPGRAGVDTEEFLNNALAWIERYLSKKLAPWRSKQNWRLDLDRAVPSADDERKLAYRLCALIPGLCREVPAASGVIDWEGFNNTHANVDLVREIKPNEEYELIELKIDANTPEYAAAQAVRNGLLYLLARKCSSESFRVSRPILHASTVRLKVWASTAFYAGFDGRIIQKAISQGFARTRHGLIDDFKFECIDPESGKLSPVNWNATMAISRGRIRHVPGPFREQLQAKTRNMKDKNFFDPEWKLLVPRLRRDAVQPDSSQAFGVNLFAPLKLDPDLANAVLSRLAPNEVGAGDAVAVQFEVCFPEIASRLNEKGIATQVDVLFTVQKEAMATKLLVEVKLAEEHFGGCKGWFDPDNPPTRNPDRNRCRNVMEAPESNCYMATRFSRTYWEHLKSSLKVSPDEPCPFRGSLYQLMRNYLTAKLLGSAQSIVCLQPENNELRILDLPVAGHYDAIEAFQAIFGAGAVHVWNARTLLDETASLKPELGNWREWMIKTYFRT